VASSLESVPRPTRDLIYPQNLKVGDIIEIQQFSEMNIDFAGAMSSKR
jgi:hypothetical protein